MAIDPVIGQVLGQALNYKQRDKEFQAEQTRQQENQRWQKLMALMSLSQMGQQRKLESSTQNNAITTQIAGYGNQKSVEDLQKDYVAWQQGAAMDEGVTGTRFENFTQRGGAGSAIGSVIGALAGIPLGFGGMAGGFAAGGAVGAGAQNVWNYLKGGQNIDKRDKAQTFIKRIQDPTSLQYLTPSSLLTEDAQAYAELHPEGYRELERIVLARINAERQNRDLNIQALTSQQNALNNTTGIDPALYQKMINELTP